MAIHPFYFERTGVMSFLLGSHVECSKKLYLNAAVNLPMTFRWCVSDIGKSSIELLSEVLDGNDFILTSRLCRLVFVDNVLRRPVAIPNDLQQVSANIKSSAEGLPKLSSFITVKQPWTIPENHFQSTIRVKYDDMDCFFHTNQGYYFTYVLECATEATSQGFYKFFTGDISFYPVKSFNNWYLAETSAGDVLDMTTWQDKEHEQRLYFVLSKENKHIFYSVVEFYSDMDFNS